ncbi:dTDP-4-dehydrorhamnose 3,5-epimerase [Hyunsoonleella aestuarii]|uniref:dTDP-4-dehydrorhamnose 3,5-epimerase n=1 Tax=Hyunsoonleella aestuarii TaxID=912802 RepID=A0ABP8E927_9FLAO|nr:dTDP-4-dehydrorhamnose 3,5-epimerase [Hyunsoonleella aestuarii]
MKIKETPLSGCFVLSPNVFEDERGYFYESFNERVFGSKTGLSIRFVQDNQSKSSRGVLRGLHFQKGVFAQAKLVRVVKGKVLDVCVDLRKESRTFGESFSVILDSINHEQFYVPRGFAHGFLVLEDDTIFSYKCDNFYNKESESGIIYNDKELNIDWIFPKEEMIISEKDSMLPTFKDLLDEF